MRRAVRKIVVALGLILLAVSALPLVPTNDWWVRVWDFPRPQIAVLLAVALASACSLFDRARISTWALPTALAMALGWQVSWLWPYTALHPVQAQAAPTCPNGSRLRLLTANVLVTNRNAQALVALVGRVQPDVVFLVETGFWWVQQLEPLRADYPHAVSHPRDNAYGMLLLSKFGLVDPQVRFLLDAYVPSIKTGVRLPSGSVINLYGVHPKPPPSQDTARRDAELFLVARDVRRDAAPAVVAGDLNDVAWSRTTRLFQETGGLLDPRIGRGMYPTFNADWPLLRWPLDHAFFEQSFRLRELAVLGDIGSDHFPLLIELCHEPVAGARQQEPRPERGDREDARDAIEGRREEAREHR